MPKPILTQKTDPTQTAENILPARDNHFSALIVELYDPNKISEDLQRAHDENDRIMEGIFLDRPFKNDTKRFKHLLELYAQMVKKV